MKMCATEPMVTEAEEILKRTKDNRKCRSLKFMTCVRAAPPMIIERRHGNNKKFLRILKIYITPWGCYRANKTI